jgi:hypothetical protein
MFAAAAPTAVGVVAVAAAGERGPSAGKEWFWLRNNPKLDPSHLLPDFSHLSAAPGSSSSNAPTYGTWASSSSSSSRPWVVPGGTWWEGGWRLGAVCLHSWPAHKERLRCFAVDPWERLLVTAGKLWYFLSLLLLLYSYCYMVQDFDVLCCLSPAVQQHATCMWPAAVCKSQCCAWFCTNITNSCITLICATFACTSSVELDLQPRCELCCATALLQVVVVHGRAAAVAAATLCGSGSSPT